MRFRAAPVRCALVCVVAGSMMSSGAADAGPTFNRDIAPILFERCAPCHRPGGAGPFSLLGYREAGKRAREIASVTGSGFMPPWLPEPGEFALVGQRGLTPEEVGRIRRWVADGAPEGDPADLPPVPSFSDGWQLGEPDLVVELPEPYELAAEGADVIRNFVVPLPSTTPRYVRTVELLPGNKRIVHHAVVKLDTTSESRRLDARDGEPGFEGMGMGAAEAPEGHNIVWAPGTTPDHGFDDIAWRLEPGSDLVLQLHMVPTGKPETIRPKVGFYFAERPPSRRPVGLLLRNEELDIPAGAASHTVADALVLPVPVEVLSLFPHAHHLGKRMLVQAELPDGTSRELLRIEDWDFNWQDDYRFVEPVELPAGARLVMRYTYDNSADNPRNPHQPPRRVVGGNRSSDEMATLAVQVLPADETDRVRLQVAQFEHIAAKEPDNAVAHYNLGVVYARQGRTNQAIRHFEKSLAIDPRDAVTHYSAGSAYAAAGALDEAVARYETAIELGAHVIEANYMLGRVRMRQGRLDQAAARFDAVLRIDPAFAPAHYNLGMIDLKRGDRKAAAEHLRRALEIDPDFEPARIRLRELE